MIRQNHRWIVTSNIGGDDYLEAAKKFGNIDKSDESRIRGLVERIRESSTVVPFAKAVAAAGESGF
jgi:hypothetical protein